MRAHLGRSFVMWTEVRSARCPLGVVFAESGLVSLGSNRIHTRVSWLR